MLSTKASVKKRMSVISFVLLRAIFGVNPHLQFCLLQTVCTDRMIPLVHTVQRTILTERTHHP